MYKENRQRKIVLSTMGNFREKHSLFIHLLLYSFMSDIETTIEGNCIAKNKAKVYWLRYTLREKFPNTDKFTL